MPDTLIHLYPLTKENDVLIATNDADSLETVLDTIREMAEVERVEMADQAVTPQMTPGQPNEVKDAGPFRYRIFVAQLPSLNAFINQLDEQITQALKAADVDAEIVVGT